MPIRWQDMNIADMAIRAQKENEMAERERDLKPNTGYLNKNPSKTRETDPDRKGRALITEPGEYWVKAWANQSRAGGTYHRLTFTRVDAPRVQRSEAPQRDDDMDDEVPFA